MRQHLGEHIGDTGDGGDAGTGVEHQYHTQAIDTDDHQQGDFTPQDGFCLCLLHGKTPF